MKKTFPKDGIKKLKETIRALKARINFLEKENSFLRKDLQNIISKKPGVKPKESESKKSDDFREDFMKRFKKEVLDAKK